MLWVLLLITALSLPFAENADARSSRDDPYGDRYGGGGGGGGGRTAIGTGIGLLASLNLWMR